MSVGEADNLFDQQLEQVLKIWIETLAQVVESEQAHQRAQEAIMLIQRALVLTRVLKDTQPFERAIAKLPQILLE